MSLNEIKQVSASCAKCMNVRMSVCTRTKQYFFRCCLDDKSVKENDICKKFIGETS